jgi:hypothetical protein
MENIEFLKTMLAITNGNMKTTQEKADADRKADREDLTEMMEEMINANQAPKSANLKEVTEEIKSSQVEL